MSDKDGRSEEKTDFWGNKYTQHYDNEGNKIATSEEKESLLKEKILIRITWADQIPMMKIISRHH